MQKGDMIFDAVTNASHVVCSRGVFEGWEAGPQAVWLARGSKYWFVVELDDCIVFVEVGSATCVTEFADRDQRVVNFGKDVSCSCRGWKGL